MENKKKKKSHFLFDNENYINKIKKSIFKINKIIFIHYKKIFYFILFITLVIINIYLVIKNVKKRNLKPYIHYINDCKNHNRYFRMKIHNKYPYISVCLPVLNMQKYIEPTLLSIINQSYQDFQIIVVNDNSKDKTKDILNIISFEDNRLKIINHSINKGVYYSRVEAILNSNGRYIILYYYIELFIYFI